MAQESTRRQVQQFADCVNEAKSKAGDSRCAASLSACVREWVDIGVGLRVRARVSV